MTAKTFDPKYYEKLVAGVEGEVVTEAKVRDVRLASGKTLALITLDNGRDYRRPNTLGPNSLVGLGTTLETLRGRAAAGEIDAVAVTGKRFNFAAGADLSLVDQIPGPEGGRLLAELGHHALGMLGGLGVPSFAFVNGLALGGGLEVALNSTYRTIDASCPAVALPEVFLGLVPGWGGATLLPNLIGIENALRVIIENPLKQNRTLKPQQAYDLGIFDRLIGAANFLEESLAFADAVLTGREKVQRKNVPGKLERVGKWDVAVKIARKQVESKLGTVPIAPYRALDILALAKHNDLERGFEAENDALGELIVGDQFRASMYAFDLVQKRAKRPAGAPDAELARPVSKVGIVGAGLMATQFATLFVRRLQVPIVITDVDQERVDRGVAAVHAELDKLAAKGRLDDDNLARNKALVTGTTDRSRFADCDWVIEAVFEEVGVKQQVFSELEAIVPEDAILATNTSSLSVDEIGSVLEHPERLVGFHFFNPVAIMPLLEVVDAEKTDRVALATAMAVAKRLKKTAVITRDRPGFVVNRVLAKVLGESMHAVDTGTPIEVVDRALDPMGLPMTPFELLELVGLKVGAHVLESHHAPFPDRFFESANLDALADAGAKLIERDGKGEPKGYTNQFRKIVGTEGKSPMSAEEFRERVETGLAEEIHIMLEEQVVAAVEDIDLCLITGAGFPLYSGGITPYLDRVGASERAFGDTFHDPLIRGASGE
ncbi:3-hydroxyacyl-CoA dehydrogenase NAD-binding domain-containing protein [Gulosibacter sp. 10]|uniref:3-hydroxyacyl-CoA dehydrogenase NAD-binding domain-containing protein n=1 Tax=Gulosibacter sp. 10 TaxID=1255570 RepID=UPI00097E8158|nr:3-hydroxyacyl-CoA dehydrogenase NAD-binding domain-containing protein [Gulosibacter sp. 10]SJM65810.1 Enoyl-CoA hydratase / 3-hydroxyacyl-CoA dehydrogenase / 3-hydroxybutyryl-CoA epimerase [Gulosibacter sp. 10]